jgi:hypothetical protein
MFEFAVLHPNSHNLYTVFSMNNHACMVHRLTSYDVFVVDGILFQRK